MHPPPVQVCPSPGHQCSGYSSSLQYWLMAMGSPEASERLFVPQQQLLHSLQIACGQKSCMQCNIGYMGYRTHGIAVRCRGVAARAGLQEWQAYWRHTCMATAYNKDIYVRSHSPHSTSQLSPAGLLRPEVRGPALPKLTSASSQHHELSRKPHIKRRCSKKLLLSISAVQAYNIDTGKGFLIGCASVLTKERLNVLCLESKMCAGTHRTVIGPLTLAEACDFLRCLAQYQRLQQCVAQYSCLVTPLISTLYSPFFRKQHVRLPTCSLHPSHPSTSG